LALSDDLASDALGAQLGGRPVRSYPALLSTEADALAWARAGAADGSVVVADYQAAPRGRSGMEWQVTSGRDLAFSVVLRPRLAVEREGWLYTLATAAVAEVCGAAATIVWPDTVRRPGAAPAAVGVVAEPGAHAVAWAVVNVLLPECERPRAPVLGRVLAAVEALAERPAEEVLGEHRSRCETLGRRVSASLLPLGPNAVRVEGTAASTLKDGALVIATDEGRRVAVRPQSVGRVEDA
jgi:BirA family biotin operon repressor/biotin-[acetyl-CoA-carboxylase] ligase